MKTKLLVLFTLLSAPSLWCQEIPKAEVFGGYSYLSADTNNLASPSRQNANGWEASVSGNLNKWFAVEGDFSGYYKAEPVNSSVVGFDFGIVNVNVRDYGFVGGPRFNFRPVFFHALIGGDHLTGSVNLPPRISASQNSFAGAFGGGVEWKVAPNWAVRGSADYVFTRHNVFGILGFSAPAETQNNFRVSIGIVYLFGSARSPASVSSEGRPLASPSCDAVSQAPILGMTGCTTDVGLKVTSIQPGSLGSKAGINPGDIVVRIDGRPVQNGRDVEAAIAASQTGTIRISYLINASWLTEREVKVR